MIVTSCDSISLKSSSAVWSVQCRSLCGQVFYFLFYLIFVYFSLTHLAKLPRKDVPCKTFLHLLQKSGYCFVPFQLIFVYLSVHQDQYIFFVLYQCEEIEYENEKKKILSHLFNHVSQNFLQYSDFHIFIFLLIFISSYILFFHIHLHHHLHQHGYGSGWNFHYEHL